MRDIVADFRDPKVNVVAHATDRNVDSRLDRDSHCLRTQSHRAERALRQRRGSARLMSRGNGQV
jgi:hypothetical protein